MAFRTLFLLELVPLLLHNIPLISSNQFEELISSPYFVDKTLMIKTLFENCKNNPYVMITCPKLFGKSTNLDMIKRFAEIEVDPTSGIMNAKKETSSYSLFNNKSLKIARHKNLIAEHLAEYPVVLLNLRIDIPVENLTFEKFLREFRASLKKTTVRFKWLLDQLIGKNLMEKNPRTENQINFIEKLLNETLTVDEISSSLLQLTETLSEYFQKKVIVLIDDYDAVINGAILTPKYNSDRIIKIIKNTIGALLEPRNPYVEFAVITGINGILYNFHFLEMKTISHHRFLSCPLFSFYFGFTNDEVNELLDRLGINQRQSERDEVVKYFNGYFALGNLPIRTTPSSKKLLFNPYSVTSYLADVAKHQDLKNFSYWTAAEPRSDFLIQFMKASEFRKFVLELVHEKIIFVKHMHNYYENELVAFKNLVDRDFADISSFDVLTCLALLFEFGYLSYTSKLDFYRIPNKEIELDVQKYLSLWYKKFTNVSEYELASIGSNLIEIINLNDPPAGKWDEFIQTSNRAFKSMVSTPDEYMPKRGLQFELRAILYLAAIENEQFEIGEKFEHDFYENYPDTAKFVVINDRGTALIILIMYEDNQTLQEAVQYVKKNKLNVKQTIICKKILSVNLLSDLSWETDYEVLFLQRDGYDDLAEQI